MNRRSIRFRLTAGYTAILAVTFAIVGVGVWMAIRTSIDKTVDKELRSRVNAIRNYLGRQNSAGDAPLEELIENAALAPPGTRFRIADARGVWKYRSPGTEAWEPTPPEPSSLPKRGRGKTIWEKGKPVRVLSAAVPLGVIQIGMPIDEFGEMLDAFTWTAFLASPVLLLFAAAGGYWMSRRALAPVGRIARTAENIEARNLSARLPLRGTGDELDHLSTTLNAMFGRLEDAFRRITQFTADASHELRTPVAIIRTTAEVIRRRPRSQEEYAQALDRILAESERTTELIEALMLLARADANVEDVIPEPVELAELVRASCADACVLAEAAGLTLEYQVASPHTVSGDRRALRRLLLILLDNAIKYSRPGGEIRLSLDLCQNRDRPGALFQVRDNGIGISPEDLPHIFERFYRASKDRSRKMGGLGLGLSIAQSIVLRHGGEIQAESRLGEGSIFHVFLPGLTPDGVCRLS